MEASVRQGLQPYLKRVPEMLRGWEVFGSYTHFTKAVAPSRTGVLTKPLAPNFYDTNTSVGLSYMTPRRAFYIDVRTSILPSAIRTLPTATDLRPVFEKRHQRWDATLRWRLNRNYALELVAANLTNDSFLDTWQAAARRRVARSARATSSPSRRASTSCGCRSSTADNGRRRISEQSRHRKVADFFRQTHRSNPVTGSDIMGKVTQLAANNGK